MDMTQQRQLEAIVAAYENGDLTPLEEYFIDVAYKQIDFGNDIGKPLYFCLFGGLIAFSLFGILPAIGVILLGANTACRRFQRQNELLDRIDRGDYVALLPAQEKQWYQQVYGLEGYQQALKGNYRHKRLVHDDTGTKVVKAPTIDIKAEQVQSPPEQKAIAVVDLPGMLASELHPLIITAKPRVGKGLVVAEMWKRAKRFHPGLTVWVIQPKPHPDESGYWHGCDRYWGKMIENFPVNDEAIAAELVEFIKEWRAQQHRPTMLIIDEQVKLAAILPKWYKNWFCPQMKVEASSGETDHRFTIVITQSPLVEDLGLSSGNRGCFDFLALERADTIDHAEAVKASMASVKSVPTDEQFASIPSGIAFFHSRLNQWRGVPRLSVPQPVATPRDNTEAIDYEDLEPDIEDEKLNKLVEWFEGTGQKYIENGLIHMNTIRSYFKPERKFLKAQEIRDFLTLIEEMKLGEFHESKAQVFRWFGK